MATKRLKLSMVLLASLLALSSCKLETGNVPAEAQPMQMQGVPARVEKPETRSLTEWAEFTGRFQAQQHVELRARVSGYLDEVKFEDGQIVEKGDVLFVIDQRPFNIAVQSARARFAAANNEYQRSKGLRKTRAISEEDYDQRLQAMRIAQADLEQAKLNLAFTEIKAPISGRISNNRLDVGNVVNGEAATNATLLTTIVSMAPIEFYFEASETDLLSYLRMKENGTAQSDRGKALPVFVKLQDEEDFIHEGKINFVDNVLSADTGTILIRAIFENEKRLFEPGMFARMRIAQGKPGEKILVPQSVIGTELTRKYVYILDDDDKAQRQYVELGTVTKDGMQVIRQGLKVDDRMVVGGLHMIQPGVLVSPMMADAAPAQVAE